MLTHGACRAEWARFFLADPFRSFAGLRQRPSPSLAASTDMDRRLDARTAEDPSDVHGVQAVNTFSYRSAQAIPNLV